MQYVVNLHTDACFKTLFNDLLPSLLVSLYNCVIVIRYINLVQLYTVYVLDVYQERKFYLQYGHAPKTWLRSHWFHKCGSCLLSTVRFSAKVDYSWISLLDMKTHLSLCVYTIYGSFDGGGCHSVIYVVKAWILYLKRIGKHCMRFRIRSRLYSRFSL